MIYLIGSLRNPAIPKVAQAIRTLGLEVFDDWHAAGAKADDEWRDYEKARGNGYIQALGGHAARHVFDHDVFHLNRCVGAALVLPAGKSGHMEFGYILGRNKPGFILMDKEPSRYDVMTRFAGIAAIALSLEELLEKVRVYPWKNRLPAPKVNHIDAMWLAGLLEGEGSFVCDNTPNPRPRIALQMTDEDMVKRAATILDARVWGPYKKQPPRKPVWATAVTGLKAASWMALLKPYLGSRRQDQVANVLAKFDAKNFRKWRNNRSESSV